MKFSYAQTSKLTYINIKKITWKTHWIPSHAKSLATVIKLDFFGQKVLILFKNFQMQKLVQKYNTKFKK